MMQPKMLILDEPTLGLAPVILEQLSKALEKVRQSDSIIVLLDEPCTTKPAPKHKIFRYLLRGLAIERPNQVWRADITHGPVPDAERAAVLNEIKVQFKRKGRVLEVE